MVARTQADLYVATDGNDQWSGTLPEPRADGSDGPFASIAGARAAIAQLRARGRSGEVVVLIRGGRYYVEPAVVTGIARDAAEPVDRVTYAPYADEEPVCSSGVDIPGWRQRQDWYLTLYLPPLLP